MLNILIAISFALNLVNTNQDIVYNVYCKENICQIETDNIHYEEVQAVCDKSASVIDGVLEEECGRLQDLYNIEYKGDN